VARDVTAEGDVRRQQWRGRGERVRAIGAGCPK